MNTFNPHRGEGTVGAVTCSGCSPRSACLPPAWRGAVLQRRRGRRPTFASACGTAPITLQGYFESGFPDITDLTAAFTKQYPTATWNVREDPFATITQDAPLTLGGPNPPDLMRLPTIGGLVKDQVLKNLNPYFSEYHWNTFPASQLAQLRTSSSGVGVGSGPLYAMGINYSLTGVFYNKALAAKIGMKSAPKTLAQLDALLAKAKAAGITPIEQFNGGATGGLLFPLQQLMADYGSARSRSTTGSSTSRARPSTQLPTLQATAHLDTWIKDGYFNSDANAVLLPQMMSNFEAGQGPAHLRRRLGVRQLRHATCRVRSASS